jgi:hypothetical protein
MHRQLIWLKQFVASIIHEIHLLMLSTVKGRLIYLNFIRCNEVFDILGYNQHCIIFHFLRWSVHLFGMITRWKVQKILEWWFEKLKLEISCQLSYLPRWYNMHFTYSNFPILNNICACTHEHTYGSTLLPLGQHCGNYCHSILNCWKAPQLVLVRKQSIEKGSSVVSADYCGLHPFQPFQHWSAWSKLTFHWSISSLSTNKSWKWTTRMQSLIVH